MGTAYTASIKCVVSNLVTIDEMMNTILIFVRYCSYEPKVSLA